MAVIFIPVRVMLTRQAEVALDAFLATGAHFNVDDILVFDTQIEGDSMVTRIGLKEPWFERFEP